MSAPFKLKSFGIFGAESGEDTTTLNKSPASFKNFPSFLDEQDNNNDPFMHNHKPVEENESIVESASETTVDPKQAPSNSSSEQHSTRMQARLDILRSREVPNSPLFGQKHSPRNEANTPSPARRLAAQEKEITNQITNDTWMELEPTSGEPDKTDLGQSPNNMHEGGVIHRQLPGNSPPKIHSPPHNHEPQAAPKRFRFAIPSKLARTRSGSENSSEVVQPSSVASPVLSATVVSKEKLDAQALPKPKFGLQHSRFQFKPSEHSGGLSSSSPPKVIEYPKLIEEVSNDATDSAQIQVPQSPVRGQTSRDAPQTPTRFSKFSRFAKSELPAPDESKVVQDKKALILPSRATPSQTEHHDPREDALKVIDWEREIRLIKEMQEYYGRTNSELVNWNQRNAKEASELQDKLVTITIELAQQTSQLVSLRDPVLEYKIHALNRKLRELQDEATKITEE